MNQEDKKKIIKNIVALEKQLNLNNQFLRLSVEKKIFSQEMMNDIMKRDSPTLDYCVELVYRGPEAFSKFIHLLIETSQYDIVHLLVPNIDVRSFSESNALGVSMKNVPVQKLIPSTSTIPHDTRDSFAETEKQMASCGFASSMQASNSHYVNQPALCQAALPVEPRREEDECLQHNEDGTLLFQVKPASEDFYAKKSQHVNCYPVNLSTKRGHVLIINFNSFDNNLYPERIGSKMDVSNLVNLFNQLNFIITLKEDVNAKEFITEIESFTEREDHKEYSSCFVFILSHGANMGNGCFGIVTKDGKKIDVELIITMFSNRNAKNLIGKPKIIVLNACRGNTVDRGVAHPMPCVPEGGYKEPRLYKEGQIDSADVVLRRDVDDTTIFKSTVPGFSSLRDGDYGSWLVLALCHVFVRKACDKDVVTLLKLTDEWIKSMKGSTNERQTAEIISRGMIKKLFLYPGLSGS